MARDAVSADAADHVSAVCRRHAASGVVLLLAALCPRAGALRVLTESLEQCDIVVAARTKKLSWIGPLVESHPNAKLRLHCSGEANTDPRCLTTAPNVAPEALMLRHIWENYNSLAPVTIFLHDTPGNSSSISDVVRFASTSLSRKAFPGFYAPHHVDVRWTDEAPEDDDCRPSSKTFGLWYNWYINNSDIEHRHLQCTGGSADSIFAVSASRLRTVPRFRYKDLLDEVERCSGLRPGWFSGPGHFMRRSWVPMFAQGCLPSSTRPALSLARTEERIAARPPSAKDRTLDLVVASFKAPLDWLDETLRQLPTARLFLYCKDPNNTDPRCIHLENVGTEEFTYFHHILHNWDSMADITIFSIDNMQNFANYTPTTRDCHDFVVSKVDTAEKRSRFSGYEALDFMPVTMKWDLEKYHASALKGELTKKELCPASTRPFGPWYLRFINASDTSYESLACHYASLHGTFATGRDQIRRSGRSVFVSLMDEILRCKGHNHILAGHFLERSWSSLFGGHCRNKEAHLNLDRIQKRDKQIATWNAQKAAVATAS